MKKIIPIEIVNQKIREMGLKDVGKASIREIRRLVSEIELATDKKYIRMEMGIPGLDTSRIAIDAEIAALERNCSSKYPPIDGIPELKREISKLIKGFLNVDIGEKSCVPTVGSINGAYAALLVSGRIDRQKDTVLFIDPGFPVHKQLVKMLGMKQKHFDAYNFRGDKLKDKLEHFLSKGNIASIIYSNPNNPSWICFTEKELKIIGELATKYKSIIIEDLAYFTMDFRKNLSDPGNPPFQPTVAKYTGNYILLISSSKSFSYAGQRIGMMAISDKLCELDFPELLRFYPSSNFGHSVIFGTIYATTAGVTHSTQYGLAALLKAINNREYNFIDHIKEYGKIAKIAKSLFISNGFKIVYDMDENKPIADGFYFTISYSGFTGSQLVKEFLYYGISVISLINTGSERLEGVRICVSLISRDQLHDLKERLEQFHKDHKGI